jgi:uncharacterized protein (DUF427 family)
MGLTSGSGPFGEEPAGRFNFTPESPTGSVLFWDPVPYRLRAFLAGEPVFDTTAARLLYETGHLPVYYVPEDDLSHELLERSDATTRCPHKGEATYRSIRVGDQLAEDAVWAYREPLEPAGFLAGHAALYWNRVDEWWIEDERVFGHPRDPYHRIDVFETRRRVRVLVEGEEIADSRRARVLFETGLPPRFYLPRDDVRMELLEPSTKQTRCAYKGVASYWHARAGGELHEDLVWTYPEPDYDGQRIAGLVCFFNERVVLELDGEPQGRPVTQWSR